MRQGNLGKPSDPNLMDLFQGFRGESVKTTYDEFVPGLEVLFEVMALQGAVAFFGL
jgi:hypothetical protein